jgi:hypothetical protein
MDPKWNSRRQCNKGNFVKHSLQVWQSQKHGGSVEFINKESCASFFMDDTIRIIVIVDITHSTKDVLTIWKGPDWESFCHNPSLGLSTKARACKGAGQEWSPGVTLHAPKRLRVWESGKIEAPHSQVNSHFGIWTPDALPNLRKEITGVKPIGLKTSLYHWKNLGMKLFKMGLHDPFGHLKHKLWSKERPGVKLVIWLPTIKSRESPRFPCV